MIKLGVIGYGSRIGNIIRVMQEQRPECKIQAITDIRNDELKAQNSALQDVHFYASFEDMYNNEELDGVLIGTRCSLHTEMALKVLPTGIPLYLEKPVSTTMADVHRLKKASDASSSEVVVSFPLRVSRVARMAKEIIDSGKIGTVEHVQATNNTPYGSVYYHSWYRDEKETGGLFLQKATHDFDYINYIVDQSPIAVCAMTSKQIFKGTKPAGLKCMDCEENRTCEESTIKLPEKKRERWAYCSFAEDTGNEDSGSALVRYESGMHVAYSQNFFVRNKAGYRGARFMGYKGTLEFNFYTSQLKVYMHHTNRVETYDVDAGNDHFGGDTMLVNNFVDVMQGLDKSHSTLDHGLTSALMCLKAKQSAETGTFQTIAWDDKF
ncbi:Gfo/Idh/MocA family oxidoreductase [Paenibacillus oryzisoli]|uniref:Gfo/Idh/MocA family protein n=1 Tax=Paenibacillus oryzisoli TaxID=1850517 RepID=UPI003D271218